MMQLSITSLNSGSNGNCYYVGNEQEAIFVDAGLSCRQTEQRMRRLGLPMQRVKAIFVSHEHHDHINAVYRLASKYQLPVYLTPRTWQASRLAQGAFPIRFLYAQEPVQIGGLSITAFPKAHDASDPHSFLISGRGVNVGVFTDIGAVCENLIQYFRQCHAVFLEANYDEHMLESGPYPYHLKQRIRGGQGHLSNQQALELFRQHKPAFMSHVLLAHLSKENNQPQLAQSLFEGHRGDTQVLVASRNEETPIYTIRATAETVLSVQ